MYKIKLLEMGISPSLKGFELLNEAIQIYTNGMPFTSDGGIYRALAKKYNTSRQVAERRLRSAILHSSDSDLTVSQFISKYKLLWGDGE